MLRDLVPAVCSSYAEVLGPMMPRHCTARETHDYHSAPHTISVSAQPATHLPLRSSAAPSGPPTQPPLSIRPVHIIR